MISWMEMSQRICKNERVCSHNVPALVQSRCGGHPLLIFRPTENHLMEMDELTGGEI